MPHNKDLNCIVFKPLDKNSDDLPLIVTTSNDACFKLWTLNTIPNESKQSWGCEFVGHYRDLIPGSATFSQDGSVLAVAFGPAATLWMTNSLSLKAVLYQRKSKMDIKQLLFGRHAGFKYLVGHNGVSITVWDCSMLCIHFIIHYDVQTLVADPYSDNIAAFCKNQNLKIFKPSSPQPLDYIRKVSDSPIVSGVFVPSATCNNILGCFKEKSQLYFMDADQNLLTVSETDEDDEAVVGDKKSVAQTIIETPFGLLQAQQTISSVEPVKVEQFNVSTKKELSLISNPTWQDPEALLKAILPNLLVKEEEEREETENTNEENEIVSETVSIEIGQDEDWLSKSLKSIEIKPIDFNFLTENVKFKT